MRRFARWILSAATLGLAAGAEPAAAEDESVPRTEPARTEPATTEPAATESSLDWVPTPTLGGTVFWGDVMLAGGHRVQHLAGSGDQCRLLSPRNLRLASGPFERCRRALDEVRRRDGVEPPSGEVVVLVHGILRSSKSMSRVAAAFAGSGVSAEPFDYPSTRVPLEESAGYLKRCVENFPPSVTGVHFVVHSMGGLLVREYLRQTADAPDPRLRRLVMIGTPNHGANLATMFSAVPAFQFLYGPAGCQLRDGEACVADALPTPTIEFAVIAGTRGTADGFNPLVPGDDDGTVALSSARLSGAADFLAVRGLHSSLVFQPSVTGAAVRFVTKGALREDGVKEPIP